MGRYTRILLSMVLLALFAGTVSAQKEKTIIDLTTLRLQDDIVKLSLTSSRPFIFGSNTYALYIGNREFTRNEQWQMDGKGFMTFLIEQQELKDVAEGVDIYLSYGQVNAGEENMDELAKTSRKCWRLGTYSKHNIQK